MQATSARLDTLEDLFQQALTDLCNAERQVIDVLLRMADAASAPELRYALTDHAGDTRAQLADLEAMFEAINARSQPGQSEGMAGIIREAEGVVSAEGDSDVRDAALIGVTQKIAHYEIAGYTALRAYARVMGLDGITDRLQHGLQEEYDTDRLLSQLTERSINIKVAGG